MGPLHKDTLQVTHKAPQDSPLIMDLKGPLAWDNALWGPALCHKW